MDIEKRRLLFFGGLIVLLILLSVGYFFWGTVFDRGTLNFIAQPPFTVEKLGGELLKCENSPCEMKLRSGTNQLVFRKDGYNSVIQDVDVKLWSKTDFEIPFEIIPQITLAEKFPQTEKDYEYNLKFDDKYNKYKLVEGNDNIALVYFNSEVKNPLIFGNKNYVFVLERVNSNKTTVYRVDLRAKKRDSFDFLKIMEAAKGTLSDDGNYLVFSDEEEENFYVMNFKDQKVFPLSFKLDLSQASWRFENELVFATRQNFSGTKFLETQGDTLIFVSYNPQKDSLSALAAFNVKEIGLEDLPEKIYTASNGQILYFKLGNDNYKLLLKQF